MDFLCEWAIAKSKVPVYSAWKSLWVRIDFFRKIGYNVLSYGTEKAEILRLCAENQNKEIK